MSRRAATATPAATRTELAWRRTLLVLVAGPIVAVRVVAPDSGRLAVVAVVLGLTAGVVLLVQQRKRLGRVARATQTESQPGEAEHLPGGRLLLSTAAATLALAALITIAVLS